MRILFALPGLHRVNRGAEAAFEEIGRHLAMLPGHNVTLMGSGQPRPGSPYRFIHVGCIGREHFERFPRLPGLRGEYHYEELTFAAGMLRAYRPADYDVTVTCAYPYTNWVLRARRGRATAPAHVFVTQNGDWPPRQTNWEYKWFGCDGLICTNPEYYERHSNRWPSSLITNGVDLDLFRPGTPEREAFGLPRGVPLILMVSALIPTKRVLEGIRAASRVAGAHLLVTGDGPLKQEVQSLGTELMGNRFHRTSVTRDRMPAIYRCADAFLHMSKEEPFGNVYVEALATGLPVVAHDWQATRWALDGAANLVDTDDLDQVAAALSAALSASSNTSDSVMARRGLTERRYSWRAIAAAYSDFLNAVMARRSAKVDFECHSVDTASEIS